MESRSGRLIVLRRKNIPEPFRIIALFFGIYLACIWGPVHYGVPGTNIVSGLGFRVCRA